MFLAACVRWAWGPCLLSHGRPEAIGHGDALTHASVTHVRAPTHMYACEKNDTCAYAHLHTLTCSHPPTPTLALTLTLTHACLRARAHTYKQKREDYVKYNKLAGMCKALTAKLAQLDPHDPVRIETTEAFLHKLYNMGLIPTNKSLVQSEKITASAFCRRRLPVVMVRVKMAETVCGRVCLSSVCVRVCVCLLGSPSCLCVWVLSLIHI